MASPRFKLLKMKIRLNDFAESLKFFLSNQASFILFTALFYAFWLVQDLAQISNFDLLLFSGTMIGIATIKNYDINARVS
jgi:hypothetical protein